MKNNMLSDKVTRIDRIRDFKLRQKQAHEPPQDRRSEGIWLLRAFHVIPMLISALAASISIGIAVMLYRIGDGLSDANFMIGFFCMFSAALAAVNAADIARQRKEGIEQ